MGRSAGDAQYYDALGRVVQVAAGTDPGPCTSAAADIRRPADLHYDDFGRRSATPDALTRSWTYSYDANDNLVSRITEDSDHHLRLDHRSPAAECTEQGGRLTTWTRNALGQPTAVKHPEANLSYTYDAPPSGQRHRQPATRA